MNFKSIKFISLILFVHSFNLCKADTYTVRKDGSGDFIAIQDAITQANNGDTVIVWPGTYKENLYIENKNITLGSLAFTTGDLQFILQTIIDGDSSGSCYLIRNSISKNILNGFTLINGTGYYCGSGNCGGGVYVSEGEVDIVNCIIKDNISTNTGGGVYLVDSFGYLSKMPPKIIEHIALDVSAGMPTSHGSQYLSMYCFPIMFQG